MVAELNDLLPLCLINLVKTYLVEFKAEIVYSFVSDFRILGQYILPNEKLVIINSKDTCFIICLKTKKTLKTIQIRNGSLFTILHTNKALFCVIQKQFVLVFLKVNDIIPQFWFMLDLEDYTIKAIPAGWLWFNKCFFCKNNNNAILGLFETSETQTHWKLIDENNFQIHKMGLMSKRSHLTCFWDFFDVHPVSPDMLISFDRNGTLRNNYDEVLFHQYNFQNIWGSSMNKKTVLFLFAKSCLVVTFAQDNTSNFKKLEFNLHHLYARGYCTNNGDFLFFERNKNMHLYSSSGIFKWTKPMHLEDGLIWDLQDGNDCYLFTSIHKVFVLK